MVHILAMALLAGCGVSGPVVYGHRGMGRNAEGNPWAENTVPAFLAALDAGADGVEIDVHPTADGELVVLHDTTLDRTTDCGGCAVERTMDELRACLAFPEDHDGAKGETLATLEETLDALPRGAWVDVDVKGPGGCRGPFASEEAYLDAAAARVVDVLAGRPRAHVSSTERAAVAAVEARAPEIATGWWVLAGDFRVHLAQSEAGGFDTVNLHDVVAVSAGAVDVSGAGLGVWVGSVDGDNAGALLDYAPEALVTDVPGEVREALEGV